MNLKFMFDKQKGQVSRLLLVLAIIVLVATIITFLVIRMAEKPPAPVGPTEPTIPLPFYEQVLGNIKFTFDSALDRGNTLKASEITVKQYLSSQTKNLSTKEKFIQVNIGAQNIGTTNTEPRAWTIENIVDSEGRNFVPLDGYAVQPWLPNPDLCGALLKPAFQPTICTKIYEVSKASTGLKIRVLTGKGNKANALASGKFDSALIDLIVK